MSQSPILPNPDQIKQTCIKSHQACQNMEIAGLELQEAIEKLEHNIRQQRLQNLKKISENFFQV